MSRENPYRWREPSTGLVHSMLADEAELRANVLIGSNIWSRCGLHLSSVAAIKLAAIAVTCHPCLTADSVPASRAKAPFAQARRPEVARPAPRS